MSSLAPGAGKVEAGVENCSFRKACMPTAWTCESDCGLTPKVDCSSSRAAAAALTVLAEDPTCRAKAFEVIEPGSGLITVTCTVPACALVAVPVAVSSVEETNVVGRKVPPNDTTAPDANFWPLTTRVKLPTGIVVGSTAFTMGAGLVSVAVPVALAVVSARLVAVTWTVLGVGTVAGAWYSPPAEIVPTVALPLCIPLIAHFTAVLPAAPFTAVRNWNVAPAATCAVGGITCTVTWPEAPTCTFMEATEAILPGSGFWTVILTVPTCAAVVVPVAVSWVGPT